MRSFFRQFINIITTISRKSRRAMKSQFFTKNWFLLLGSLALVAVILIGMSGTKEIYTKELLETIAKVESNGNYNAYFGNARNNKIKFTQMSVGEVMEWQRQFVASGSPSSAVGRYQIILPTLENVTNRLQIDLHTKFSSQLQDQLAVELLEQRGLSEYVHNKMSREQFAHNLSKEWAALPKVIGDNPSESYYSGDGLNKARLSIEELYASLATLRKM